MAKNHRFITVAGVMGSGKTSACKLLADRLGFELFEENLTGNKFLPLFYRNPKRWALASQLQHLSERAIQLDRIPPLLAKNSVIQDGPIYDDYLTYTGAQHKLGYISDSELALYEKLFNSVSKHSPVPSLIIHLDVSVPVILQRIRTRGRDFEKNVKLPYLRLLAELQKDWLAAFRHAPVLTVNTDELNLISNAKHQKKFVELVATYIEKLPA